MIKNLILFSFWICLAGLQTVSGQKTSFHIGPEVLFLNGQDDIYRDVDPGDTLFFDAGNRSYLLIKNFQGEEGKPIVMINSGGTVIIDTDHYFGISIQNCRYFKFTGTGNPAGYGFKVTRVANGSGMGIGDRSSDFEIDHISIENCSIGGIYAKTDPDCSFIATRENFTQFNTIIHDNYIANSGNEGLYVGSAKYFGQNVNCNGKDTLLLPSLLDGVQIYNNIVKYSGWDGIQVSSASTNCKIFSNLVMFDSQAEYASQMSGIIIGGGTKCDCYNNVISGGRGDGIEVHGLGGTRVYNNIIVNAGRSFLPDDLTQMKHGIFISDVSVENDSAFFIQNNTIINPKSDGIRFSSILSRDNLIASNAIINPGNFDYYENGNTRFKGKDSYLMIPDASASIVLKNNFFERDIELAGMAADFSLLENSPLIDSGYSGLPLVPFDFNFNNRPIGTLPDIGAFEFNPKSGILKQFNPEQDFIVFPNPVKSNLTMLFQPVNLGEVSVSIFNLSGVIVKKQNEKLSLGTNTITLSLTDLTPGIYLYSVKSKIRMYSGKFIKAE